MDAARGSAKRMLVTGGTGFLGSEVVSRATSNGWSVIAPPHRGSMALDLEDERSIVDALVGCRPDVVVHTAYSRDGSAMSRVIVEGSSTLARACALTGAQFVHVSSDAVFGGRTGRPYSRSTLLIPPTPTARRRRKPRNESCQSCPRQSSCAPPSSSACRLWAGARTTWPRMSEDGPSGRMPSAAPRRRHARARTGRAVGPDGLRHPSRRRAGAAQSGGASGALAGRSRAVRPCAGGSRPRRAAGLVEGWSAPSNADRSAGGPCHCRPAGALNPAHSSTSERMWGVVAPTTAPTKPTFGSMTSSSSRPSHCARR